MLNINAFAFVFPLPGITLIHFWLHAAAFFIYHRKDKKNRMILNAKLPFASLKIRVLQKKKVS